MKNVVIQTLCDLCPEDAENEGGTYQGVLDGKIWEVDLCEEHVLHITLVEFQEALQTYGVASPKESKPKKPRNGKGGGDGEPNTVVTLFGTEVRINEFGQYLCPDCGNAYKSRGSVRLHMRQNHQYG